MIVPHLSNFQICIYVLNINTLKYLILFEFDIHLELILMAPQQIASFMRDRILKVPVHVSVDVPS